MKLVDDMVTTVLREDEAEWGALCDGHVALVHDARVDVLVLFPVRISHLSVGQLWRICSIFKADLEVYLVLEFMSTSATSCRDMN